MHFSQSKRHGNFTAGLRYLQMKRETCILDTTVNLTSLKMTYTDKPAIEISHHSTATRKRLMTETLDVVSRIVKEMRGFATLEIHDSIVRLDVLATDLRFVNV